MFKIYGEPKSSKEGACSRHMIFKARPRGPTPLPRLYVSFVWAAQAKIYCERFSPNVGGVLKTEMVNRNYQTRGRVLQIYGEPESPNDRGCLTRIMNRYRQMMGHA